MTSIKGNQLAKCIWTLKAIVMTPISMTKNLLHSKIRWCINSSQNINPHIIHMAWTMSMEVTTMSNLCINNLRCKVIIVANTRALNPWIVLGLLNNPSSPIRVCPWEWDLQQQHTKFNKINNIFKSSNNILLLSINHNLLKSNKNW